MVVAQGEGCAPRYIVPNDVALVFAYVSVANNKKLRVFGCKRRGRKLGLGNHAVGIVGRKLAFEQQGGRQGTLVEQASNRFVVELCQTNLSWGRAAARIGRGLQQNGLLNPWYADGVQRASKFVAHRIEVFYNGMLRLRKHQREVDPGPHRALVVDSGADKVGGKGGINPSPVGEKHPVEANKVQLRVG